MNIVTLKEVCRITNGGTPKSGVESLWHGGVAWLTPAEMGKRLTPYIEKTARTISQEGLANSSAKLVPPGSVILSTRAPIGHLAINEIPMAFNQGCRGLTPGEKLDVKYLYYFLYFSRDALDGLGTGTTFKELSSSNLASFKIPLPNLKEQRRIVAVLDKAFAGIATATANAQKNLSNARALFESYLRSVFDTPNLEWHRTTLGKLTTKIGSGATPRGGKDAYEAAGTPLIRSMNVHDRFFKEHNLAFINDNQAKLLNNVVVQRNDVLLNITGASVARCCIVPDQWTNGRVNQHVAIIRADAETIRPRFVELALTSPFYKDILLGVGEKGGSTRQAITKADIQKLDIAFPDLAEQDSFVDHATSIQIETRKLADIASKKLNALTELKQSLLQKAFAGALT